MKPNWDYKENLSLKPCECREECGNYILFVKGEMAHVKGAPEGEQIDIVSLSLSDLYDLYFNVEEVLKIDIARDSLIKQFNKNIKKEKN